MEKHMQRIQIIDSHTGGEPTRLVIGGFPDLGTGTMAERRAVLAAQHDAWRATTVSPSFLASLVNSSATPWPKAVRSSTTATFLTFSTLAA